MSKAFKLIISCLFLLSCSGYSQKAEIYGKWYFDRFGGPHGEIVKDGEIAKANQLNNGISFTFTKDNRAVVEQADGTKMNASFQYLVSRKIVIVQSDTMRIMLLTSDILELYPTSETKPALFLKRNKDGKTPMSVQ